MLKRDQITKMSIVGQFVPCTYNSFAKWGTNTEITSSSAIAEGPRDALGQLKSCQLLHNCTKNDIELQGLPFHVV